MAVIDIVFAAVILFAAIRVAIRGFVTELMSMAALVLSIAAATLLAGPVANLIDRMFAPSSWNQVIGFLVVFLTVYLIVKLLEGALERLVDRVNLESLDHALGLFLGLIEGIVVVLLIVYLLSIQPFFDPSPILANAWIPQFLLKLLPAIAEGI